MRIAIIGQQDFGKATLEAFLNRGDTVAAVFCAPEKGRPDQLRVAAEERGVPVHQFPKLTDPAAQEALRQANADVGVMAYVTQFVPQDFCSIPKFGTIQFHPSLLPLHRGASSMSWAIICGRTETGFSIFRPTNGLDEGPVILTRAVPIEPEDTLGSLYFGKIFPMGVAALVEVAELAVAGKAPALVQYEPNAGYEGILRDAESRINWANHVDIIYNLVRGCDPAPGAWTTMDGKKLFVFNATKRIARTFSEVKGKKLGEVVAISGKLVVHGQGGFIEFERVRLDGGRKVAASEAGIAAGTILGISTMIYELRTYTFHNGKLPAYIQHVEKVGRPVRGDDYGKCLGYWTAEFGQLNQAWHLWSYASLDERTRMREALSKNERWTKEYVSVVQPMLQRQDIRFLNPVVDIKPPAASGGVYELRIYRTQPGKAAQWAQLFKSVFPVREKYSPNVCLWTGEAPQPNEAVHMWNYPDVNTRMKVRAECARDPAWQAFIAEGGPLLLEMQSTLLMPTPFSLMR